MPTIIDNQKAITTSANRTTPDQYTSRVINGKQRYFGFWRGERNEKSSIFKAYNQAITAAEEVEKMKNGLAKDPNLTPQGQLAALRDATLPFFTAKSTFVKAAAAERDTLKKKVNKTLQLENYDTSTNMQHHRLIEAFKALNPKQRASTLLPHNLSNNPALARALIAENALVSGVQEDERERIQTSLLSDEDMVVLEDAAILDKQISAAEKAFGTATEVLVELAEFTEEDIQLLATIDGEEPPKDKAANLANGGVIKLTQEDANDET